MADSDDDAPQASTSDDKSSKEEREMEQKKKRRKESEEQSSSHFSEDEDAPQASPQMINLGKRRWIRSKLEKNLDSLKMCLSDRPVIGDRGRYEIFGGSSPGTGINVFWTLVHHYKMSIIQMYQMEQWRTFICSEHRSNAALYTEPVIIQKDVDGFVPEAEVCVEHFFGDPIQDPNPMAVILQGSSGSGKSSIVQRIMFDWASEKYHAQFDLVFYLSCEELMCFSEEMSFNGLLSWSCGLPLDRTSEMLQQFSSKVLFIIDGFDELRLTQDIFHTTQPTDLFQKAPPEVCICALLRGQILPESFLLVTTRSSDTQKLNKLLNRPQCFKKIVGFSEKKIEEYFQKFFQDEELFRNAYESVKANETLFTACSSPVICWIICTVIRERFNDGTDVTSGLETTTSIYVDLVSTLLEHHCQGLSESVPTLLKSLGQLAERGVMERQVLFDERTINETVQDPVHNPFLNKFLLEKRIQQETMFRFMHLSFQEFFTAFYYVLLDEDESQSKVRDLLHTVERGWALSCWSVADFSNRDSEIIYSKQLQSVILFLWGFCKNKSINSFFEKHNVTLPVNIETQLKEWIYRCSLRYQHENMLFILHCLHELHDKSFTGNVLEGLILIDLSNIPLNRTDCCVLRFCLQCCQHIKNLRLNITSDNLKILQPALCSCEELWLMVNDSSDDVGDFISALGEGKIQNHLMIKVDEKRNRSCPEIIGSVRDGNVKLSVSSSKNSLNGPVLLELTLTCPRPVIYTINWRNVLQTFMRWTQQPEASDKEVVTLLEVLHSASGLKQVQLQVEILSDTLVQTILSLIQTCPTLSELGIKTILTIPQEVIQTLQESLKHMNWTLNIWRKSVLLKRNGDGSTEELKTKYIGETLVSFSTLQAAAQGSLDEFTPKLIERDDIKGENMHRFVSPHAGQFQCSLTNLVFVMEGEGEMLYKMVPWDPRRLDGLGQMQPAGPLYDIDCFEGSVSQLHFPHCEILTEENKDSLAVAHFIDDNVEMLQPLKVTSTHVIIDVTEFSLFGLIKKIIFPASPVRYQVLLFVRPISVKQKEKILDVHLLPRNVPVSEVKSQHKENRHVQTSSKCRLTPGREYSLCFLPEGLTVQPKSEVFEFDFDPNFHPMFEVILDVNVEVKLGLLDKTAEETTVWTQRRILLTASGSSPDSTAVINAEECKFVDKHRNELIQRVTSVMEIADCLKSKKMITDEMWSEVHAENTHRKQMRILYMVLISGGPSVKAEFYRLLKEKEPHLVDSLEFAFTSAQ
ncbi:NACHT, LRR and PYD domains-containing protein 1 homolog isoform X2 [Triplophysa rosa]|uniref:NACHT, LRR and PYD domains-containing protein 1 homolog isoform X2 n=1 Tax=Triplophysa rosa TaxID=992332 RepID=UPI002545EAB5|nr:NACHT, LRR and PYD domains-containing protein 1 homolog isoform X2 [Triplophysa rosa]